MAPGASSTLPVIAAVVCFCGPACWYKFSNNTVVDHSVEVTELSAVRDDDRQSKFASGMWITAQGMLLWVQCYLEQWSQVHIVPMLRHYGFAERSVNLHLVVTILVFGVAVDIVLFFWVARRCCPCALRKLSLDSRSPPQQTVEKGKSMPKRFTPRQKGDKVARALSRMSTGTFGKMLDEQPVFVENHVEVLRSLPAEVITAGETWKIAGMYEHQALKVGLRRIDMMWGGKGDAWGGPGLLAYPKGQNKLLKEGVLKALIAGQMHLRSLQGAELVGVQPDLRKLNLCQMLRLRVLLLDYVPSGAGNQGIQQFGFQQAHENFVRILDTAVLEKLGCAIQQNSSCEKARKSMCDTTAAALARDALLMSAGASSLSESYWWVWWLPGDGDDRVFFNVNTLTAKADFPSCGALEADKQSKLDLHDPSNTIWMMDWTVKLRLKQKDLIPSRPTPKGRDGIGKAVESPAALQDARKRLKPSNSSVSSSFSLYASTNSATWDAICE